MTARRVLFLCVHNAGRSQMAEAFAKLHGAGSVEASSGGTLPAKNVNPIVVEVMRERGIDLEGARPKAFDVEDARRADAVITMGCSIEGMCPAPLLEKVVDWKLEDPSGKSIEEVRRIRDEIERQVLELLRGLAASGS